MKGEKLHFWAISGLLPIHHGGRENAETEDDSAAGVTKFSVVIHFPVRARKWSAWSEAKAEMKSALWTD